MIRCMFVLILTVSVLVLPPVAIQAQPEQPNILFIISDDQGWADIGYYGSDVLTPNLDRLAADGIRLEQHYVYPTCSPTRAALITGRGPSRFGILGPIAGRSQQALAKDITTLPGALKALGYQTAISGKWHLGLRPEVGPRQYGFDSTYGYLHGQIDPYTHLYKIGDRSWHRNDQLIDEQGHATDLITNEAIRVIESAGGTPFFLYVAYSVPHSPLNEPQKWTAPYEDRIKDPSRRRFAASITHMDHAVGRMLDALKRTGKRRHTLIIFTSDNGGQQSWHSQTQYKGRYAKIPHNVLGNNRPLRGWKGQLYEGGIRVPALVSWPGVLKSSRVDTPTNILDWFPTLVTLAQGEVDPKDRLEGQNIWPLLTGRAAPTSRVLYWKTRNQSALREGEWKLILTSGQPTKVELFNVGDDPYENHNVAAEHPERISRLRKLLAQRQRLDP